MRATFGSFSGPITTNATTPITINLVRPRSIIIRVPVLEVCAYGGAQNPAQQPHAQSQVLVFSFTSTSIVVFSASCAGGAAFWASGLSSAPFTPSLNPLTALPRSDPILVSFLVPNTNITITSNISQ